MSYRTPPDPAEVDRRETIVTREEGGVPAPFPEEVASERVVVDYAAERQATLNRVSQVISFIFGAMIILIGIRVLLRLIAANPENAFAQFIYGITAPMIAPFATLTGTPSFDAAVLEVPSLIAMLVYALVAWGLIKLVWLLFYRPATREASSSRYRR